tara:strand:- start:4316 stop:5467 length:1152 start_codon:yes stop_codon:yes gene_type:complete
MNFFSKKRFKRLQNIFYKEEYENLLQQDQFWFKSVTWGIIGTALFGISWLSFAKTDEIILVSGKIVPIGDIKEIQMPIGGIAKEILVKDGDTVEKGDLLIQLDKESSLAEFRTLNESLNLKERQLMLKQREYEVFIESRKKNIELLNNIEKLDREISVKYYLLFKEGAGSEVEYLRQKIKSQDSFKALKNAESELDIQSDIYKQNLDEIRSQINEIKGRLAENNVKQRYQSLVAPIKGVVFDIQPKIVGYTAQATETILKIVPESELEARVEIPSEDIGFVKDGMRVDISIDSYPATDFGVIEGFINNISSDALKPDQSAQSSVFSYPAKITLDSQFLKLDNGNKLKLKAGMSLNASVKLRKVSYLRLLLSSFKNKTDSLKEL